MPINSKNAQIKSNFSQPPLVRKIFFETLDGESSTPLDPIHRNTIDIMMPSKIAKMLIFSPYKKILFQVRPIINIWAKKTQNFTKWSLIQSLMSVLKME
jgi:hypothetical protein